MKGAAAQRPFDVFLVAAEPSADELGAQFIAALQRRLGEVQCRGVGGSRVAALGVPSLFPPEDVSAIGFGQVVTKLPTILRRLRQVVAAIRAEPPDLLVLIDNPDLNYRIAKRVRAGLPKLPIVQYVSPTVWIWRPGRARALAPVVDHVLALFPFEPQVYRDLGGPPCTYVGHPLLERLADLRPSAEEQAERRRPLVLLLPGSRRSEIRRLGPEFGAAAALIASARPGTEFVVPTLLERADELAVQSLAWPVRPPILTDAREKYRAFRRARAAIAASGTVTLELALAQVPMVAAYKVPRYEEAIIRLLTPVRTPVLPDLILGKPNVPVLLQSDCTPERLRDALLPLLDDGPARGQQLEAFARLDSLLDTGGETPSDRAVRTAIAVYEAKAGRRAPRLG